MTTNQPIKASEAMQMNRRDRRILGKINGVKIPGIQERPLEKKVKSKDSIILDKIIDENNSIKK